MHQVRVFADTNVILEAFRTRCWTAITTHFAVETVEKCVEETLTGNPGDPRHVPLRIGLSSTWTPYCLRRSSTTKVQPRLLARERSLTLKGAGLCTATRAYGRLEGFPIPAAIPVDEPSTPTVEKPCAAPIVVLPL